MLSLINQKIHLFLICYILADGVITVARDRRTELLAKWRAKGGVFLIGYTAFRNLSLGKHVKDLHMAREIRSAFQVIVTFSPPVFWHCNTLHIYSTFSDYRC